MKTARGARAWIAGRALLAVIAVTTSAPGAHVSRAAESGGVPPARATEDHALTMRRSDRIVLLGNTLAERQQHFNHFETLLMTRFHDLQLVVRNLGWSGDTLTLQPRPLNFGDAAMHLQQQQADVILAFFGLNESFGGEAGLVPFARDLEAYLETHRATTYNGKAPPRVALVSPIAHERLAHLQHVDVDRRNRELALYVEVMRRVAAARGVPFVDLFTPTAWAAEKPGALTINGIHVSEAGDRLVAALLMEGLGFALGTRDARGTEVKKLEALRETVRRKNEEFFRRWRPLNAEYVVGRRVDPFGSVNFPPEMRKLDSRVDELDRRIWKTARGLGGLRYPAVTPADVSAAEGRH